VTPLRLDNRTARRIFLERHGLSAAPQGASEGQDLLELIHRLGFVQLDSINTVARAHDLIIFSRRRRYRPKHLKRLYEKDRGLFEHWTHDAAVIPMAFYPWWHLRRQRDAENLRRKWKEWRRDGFEAQFNSVIERIRAEGPLCSADVGIGEKRGSGGWWDWHPSKTAMEYLWRSGRLCVTGRDAFRKRYDLAERVIDQTLRDETPSEAETIDWCCREAMQRLGFATHTELSAFWAHISPAEAKAWCLTAVARGEIIDVEVQDVTGDWRRAYAFADIDLASAEAPCDILRVLSPFDPALRDRKRAHRLFGFDYRIEIFVPEAQRKYGYYVFPVLEGDRIVARVDMKALRDQDRLHVRALWPEPGVRWGKARRRAFEAEVQRLTRLAGVAQVSWADDWLRVPIATAV